MITITAFKNLTTAKISAALPLTVSSNKKLLFYAAATEPVTPPVTPAVTTGITNDQVLKILLGNDSDPVHVADAQRRIDAVVKVVEPTKPPVTPSPVTTPPVTNTVVDKPNWLGEWNDENGNTVENSISGVVNSTKNTSLFVLYNIPFRDNGNFSAGGLHSAAEYDTWVKRVAKSIGNNKAIVVLEPDALGLSRDSRFTDAMRTERFAIMNNAIKVLKANTNTLVFADSSVWAGVDDSVGLLGKLNGMDGFSCNVSGYLDQPTVAAYADAVAKKTGLKYVCDTSRNGNGAPHGSEIWCNQTDTKVGQVNTMSPTPTCYAYLWIKVPGESDGLKINGKDGDGKPENFVSAGTYVTELHDALYSGNWTAFKSKYGS